MEMDRHPRSLTMPARSSPCHTSEGTTLLKVGKVSLSDSSGEVDVWATCGTPAMLNT